MQSLRLKAKNEQTLPLSLYPKLIGQVHIYSEQIVLSQGDRYFTVATNDRLSAILQKIFSILDGTNSLPKIQQQLSSISPDIVNQIILDLERQGFIDDVRIVQDFTNSNPILELAELTRELFIQDGSQAEFWEKVNLLERDKAIEIVSGWAIEQYHFWSQQCYFNSGVLGFSKSIAIRKLIEKKYTKNAIIDEILLAGLHNVNISSRDLINSRPLPETTAIYYGLTHWSNFEPVFFLTIIELWEQQLLSSYVSCFDLGNKLQMEASFLCQLEKIIDILRAEKIAPIWQNLPQIDLATKKRFQNQIVLFVEMYGNFYRGIWNYYATTHNLLRTLNTI